MSVNIHSFVGGLLQELLKILKVMTAYKYARTIAHTYINLCYFRVTIGVGICCVNKCHNLDTSLANIKNKRKQFIRVNIGTSRFGHSIFYYGIYIIILKSEISRMTRIGGHAFTTINGKLLKTTNIRVFFGKHTGEWFRFFSIFRRSIKFYLRKIRKLYALFLGCTGK